LEFGTGVKMFNQRRQEENICTPLVWHYLVAYRLEMWSKATWTGKFKAGGKANFGRGENE